MSEGQRRVSKPRVPKKRYVLSHMPEEWTSLPVHVGSMPARRCDSFAVYSKNREGELVKEGFVCPIEPPKLVTPRPKRTPGSLSLKHKLLLEKIGADEETRRRLFPDAERGSAAGSGRVGAEPEPGAMPGRGEAAAEPKQQVKAAAGEGEDKREQLRLPLQGAESSVYCPLLLDVLARAERLIPGADWSCFERLQSDMEQDMLNFLYSTDG